MIIIRIISITQMMTVAMAATIIIIIIMIIRMIISITQMMTVAMATIIMITIIIIIIININPSDDDGGVGWSIKFRKT